MVLGALIAQQYLDSSNYNYRRKRKNKKKRRLQKYKKGYNKRNPEIHEMWNTPDRL